MAQTAKRLRQNSIEYGATQSPAPTYSPLDLAVHRRGVRYAVVIADFDDGVSWLELRFRLEARRSGPSRLWARAAARLQAYCINLCAPVCGRLQSGMCTHMSAGACIKSASFGP